MARLVPMTSEQLREWLTWSIPEYAEAHVRAGTWDAAHALEQSKAEHDQLLPKGVATPDHFLRMIVDESTGTNVGEVWYNLQKQGEKSQVFVFWIGIREEHRRHGYATAALRRVEEEARTLGAGRVALHVFADNTGAQALYRRLGYDITNLIMAKPLK